MFNYHWQWSNRARSTINIPSAKARVGADIAAAADRRGEISRGNNLIVLSMPPMRPEFDMEREIDSFIGVGACGDDRDGPQSLAGRDRVMKSAERRAADPEALKCRRGGWLVPIENLQAARSAARRGAAAGLTLAAFDAFLFLSLMQANSNAAAGSPADLGEDLLSFVVVCWTLVAAILFLSWRVGTGRGHISAIILLPCAWLQPEAHVPLGLAFFLYLAIFAGLLDGIRGCWKARRFRALENMARRF